MKIKYFGTDGIRGIVGNFPITPDFFFKLGVVIGRLLFSCKSKSIVIGRDTRVSGDLLESALRFGLFSSDVSIISVGIVPTSAIAYFVKLFNLEVGIMISASHNQYQDNGIKIFIKGGVKLPILLEQQIEQELKKLVINRVILKLGSIIYRDSWKYKYVDFCKSTLSKNFSFKNVTIVLDCANGSTYLVAPKIFKDLGADVISIFNYPNGYNINNKCGTTNLNNLRKRVISEKADLGIAFDGDGDRVLFIDHIGNIVNGDQILYILAKNYQKNKKLKGGVVCTQFSNKGLLLALNKHISYVQVSVGDRNILNKLQEKNWILGAESSGHIILLDKISVGDGIIASLQIVKIIIEEKTTLKNLCSDIRLLPQIIVNIKKYNDINFLKHFKVRSYLSKYRKFLGKHSRIILRLSGTEKCVRIMIEGYSSIQVNNFSKELIRLITSIEKVDCSVVTVC